MRHHIILERTIRMITSPKADEILELLETILTDLSNELLERYDSVDIRLSINATFD
ncbi:hypothetical protein AAC03nite_20570 [Alicyclobacillus acidoterrestris]|nr:hypothetical protein AAC03nite_20570 [Alicyclobacillus acidoterrestris]